MSIAVEDAAARLKSRVMAAAAVPSALFLWQLVRTARAPGGYLFGAPDGGGPGKTMFLQALSSGKINIQLQLKLLRNAVPGVNIKQHLLNSFGTGWSAPALILVLAEMAEFTTRTELNETHAKETLAFWDHDVDELPGPLIRDWILVLKKLRSPPSLMKLSLLKVRQEIKSKNLSDGVRALNLGRVYQDIIMMTPPT